MQWIWQLTVWMARNPNFHRFFGLQQLKYSSEMCRKASRNTFLTHIWEHIWEHIQQIQQNTPEALKKNPNDYLGDNNKQYLIIYIIICAPGIQNARHWMIGMIAEVH